ncbi:hypothetical protein ACFYOC_07995 [Nocardiopsis alba]|uniref:hypothetical protein n=1 Tax=Nocardiopsis alba TaxID=53437 RepID=UPI00369CCE9A
MGTRKDSSREASSMASGRIHTTWSATVPARTHTRVPSDMRAGPVTVAARYPILIGPSE